MSRAEPDPRRWKALAVISVAYLMVILDISIVNVALPAIQADLGFSVTNLQWVVSGYGLTFAGFLLLAGRCGDLLGRRRVFMGGLALFSLASLVCGLAESTGVLIAARGVQGVAGAVLTASAFSLVGVTFDEGDDRNKALGVLGAVSGGGAALGVVLGGVLTDYLGWAWIFLVNVPVGLVALGFGRLVVSESREAGTTRHFDAQGAVVVTAGLVMAVYTITRAPALGWGTTTTIGLLAGSVGLLASFVFVELRSSAPLVPLQVFRRRTFAAANLIGFGVGMSTISTFFLLSLYMQQVLGFTALQAGVAYLSVTCGTVVASAMAYGLIALVGVKIALGSGIAFLVGSLVCFTAVSADGSYVADLLPGFVLIGLALGLTFVPLSVVSLAGFSDRETGLASGLFNTSQQIGAALGVAVVATVAAAHRTEVSGQVGVTEGLTAGFAVALGTAVAALITTFVVLRRTDDVRLAEGPRSPCRSKRGWRGRRSADRLGVPTGSSRDGPRRYKPVMSESVSATIVPESGSYLPCSRAQEGLWLLEQVADIGSGNNLPLALELTGALDETALRRAVADLIGRHPALRTGFVERNGGLARIERNVQEWGDYDLDLVDHHGDLPQALAEVSRSLLDPFSRPPFTITLIRASATHHLLIFVFHHLVFDGTSKDVLLNDLAASYSAHARGNGSPLSPVVGSYAAYVEMERERMAALAEKAMTYWGSATRCTDDAPQLFDGVRASPVDAPRYGETVQFVVDGRLKAQLTAIARHRRVSLFCLLLAAVQTLQYRYAGGADGTVATAIAMGTRPPNMQDFVGMFVNEAPAHTLPRPDLAFNEFLVDVGTRVRELGELRLYPYTEVAARLGSAPSVVPEVSVGYRRAEPLRAWTSELHAEPQRLLPNYGTRWPLAFQFLDEPECVLSRIDFDPSVVPSELAENMAGHFQNMLSAVARDPAQALSAIKLLSVAERQRVLVDWSSTSVRNEKATVTSQIVEEQASRTPEAIAVVCGTEEVTYAEINARANRLAHYLIRQGVGPETLVGLCLRPGIEFVIALLAIFKAGGAYMPLDPSYPRERLAFMLKDANVSLILSEASLADELPATDATALCIDRDSPEIAQESDQNPMTRGGPDSLAFVLYTSGSTGLPKGVLGLQRTIVSRITDEPIAFEADERLCQKTSLNFIDSIWEVFAALARGLPTVIAPVDVRQDPAELIRLLEAQSVTRLVVVPSLLRAILDLPDDLASRLPALRYWISSGETLRAELCDRFFDRLPEAVLINLYGTTECWDATWYDCRDRRCQRTGRVPVGRPIANARAYVFDHGRQPVPAGAVGELYVGGPGVARGYVNHPRLNADRFIADPFGSGTSHLYRTGDRARWRAGGILELLGRTDRQLKIRGYRIEPGEIEAALLAHPSIREAAVVPSDDADPRLVAYVVFEAASAPSPAELRSFLSASLPQPMVPGAFVGVAALPLTPSGKLDREGLSRAAPEPGLSGDTYVAPRTRTEHVLAGIWAHALRVERVGVSENFFELGGHSLLATEVIARVRSEMCLEVPVRYLFEGPTVAELANKIDTVAGPASRPTRIPRADRPRLADLLRLHE